MTDAYADPLYTGDVAIGDTGPEVVVEGLKRENSVRYAGASGDFNPIHYDEPYAKEAGNDSVFAQGTLTARFVAHMLSNWFGLETSTGSPPVPCPGPAGGYGSRSRRRDRHRRPGRRRCRDRGGGPLRHEPGR